MSNQKTEKTNEVKIETTKSVVYDSIGDMETKAIKKELRAIAPRQGKLSLTERNMLECVSDGGAIVRDDRDAKDRQYAKYMQFADGDKVSLRPDGFRYLIRFAKRYGLNEVTTKNGKIITWTLPKNSNRLPYVKRLVELFDAV